MTAVISRLPTASYEAGKSSQYHKAPRTSGSGDATVGAANTKLRDWARWLDENLDIVTGSLDKFANFIVGNGITIEPLVRNRRGELLPRVNDQIRRAVIDETIRDCWSRDVNVTGDLTRGEQEWLACRTWLRDGEVLARSIRRRAQRTSLPYRIQLIESDHLPFELIESATDQKNAIVHGVEKDDWGKPAAYHLYRQHPGDVFLRSIGLLAGETVRVPANEIAHLKFSRRINQTRGVPILHSTIFRLDDIADYENSHRIGARVAAALLGSLKRSPDMIDYDPASDERDWPVESGQILSDLLPGEELSWFKPEAPNTDATPFLDDQLRRYATGIGLGYSTVSGKYDKSFSAARQEQSEYWPNIEKLRAQFVSDFVRSVEYEPALEAAITTNRVRIPKSADPDTIFSADYRGPSRPTIDDEKQAKTDQLIIDTKTDSRVGRIRERGRDPTKVDAEIAQDMDIDDSDSAMIRESSNAATESQQE